MTNQPVPDEGRAQQAVPPDPEAAGVTPQPAAGDRDTTPGYTDPTPAGRSATGAGSGAPGGSPVADGVLPPHGAPAPAGNQPPDNQPPDNQPPDNQPLDNQPLDNQPPDNQPPDNRPPGGGPAPADNPPTAGRETAGRETAGGEQPPGGYPPPGGGGYTPPGGGGGYTPPGGGGFPPPGGFPRVPPDTGGFATRYGLARPANGRVLAGVCAAIARATNTDPILWRVLFVVLSLIGVGIVAYLFGWLFIPAEGDSASAAEALVGRGHSSTSPVVTVILGLLAIIALTAWLNRGFNTLLLVVVVIAAAVVLLARPQWTGTPPEGRTAPPGDPGAPVGPPPAAPYQAAQPYGGPTQAYAGGSQQSYGAPASGGTQAYGGAPGYAGDPARPAASTGPAYGSPQASAGRPGTGPVPPGGYRPPFAPHGPYLTGGYPPPPARPVAPPREPSILGRLTLSAALLAVGILALLQVTGTRFTGPAYPATALAVVGFGLLIGAWFGHARWLIAIGIVLALVLGGMSGAERIRYQTPPGTVTSGNQRWEPTSFADLRPGYATRFGNGDLDLRALDFRGRDETVTVTASFGNFTVEVPPGVDVQTDANIRAGNVDVFGQRWSGMNITRQWSTNPGNAGPGGGHLLLHINVRAGSVEVSR